jgi:hypothetical protein
VSAAFLVERYLPGAKPATVRAGVARVQQMLGTPSGEDLGIRYLGCTFLPDEETVLCRFEAPSPEALELLNRRARFRYDRIVAAEELLQGAHRDRRGEG